MSPNFNSFKMKEELSLGRRNIREENNIDPFTNEINLKWWDYIWLIPCSFLALIRAILVISSLILAWIVAKIGLFGLPPECIDSPARTGWRRTLLSHYGFLAKVVFWSAGFWVTVKGKQATRAEAPILVGAPHSTFLEALIIIMCGSSPVSRHENRTAILISAIQLFFQTIFVDRRKSDSRKNTIEQIKSRSLSPDNNWTQIFLCPEGTNTNRKVLIQFKIGAFVPGVPVQPVLIRYPGYDRIDSITWTYKQSHSYKKSVWLCLSRPYNRVQIEFLPVYTPNENEKQNPQLYAKNVQLLMANKLGLDATDITYSRHYNEYVQKYQFIDKDKNK